MQNCTMTQVLAFGAVVAVSAVATGYAVSSSAPATSLYASTAVQSAVAARPVAQFNRAAPASHVAPAAAYPVQAAADYQLEDVAPVQFVQHQQGVSISNMLAIPVVALIAGAAAYLFSAKPKQDVLPRFAMAATSGEKESEETDLAKSYKAGGRADSYYGKGASSAKETVDPSKVWDYKAPVGGYSAENNKTYTQATGRDGSYYGTTATGKADQHPYSPPTGGYSADNGKTYTPTTSTSASYMGANAAAPKPIGSYWYGPDRPKWLGPLSSESAVAPYLKGELPGDYGFDTAGFGSDPATLEKMVEAEIQHGRWAMLGALGCLAPELANKYPEITRYTTEEPVWFKAGAHIMANAGLDWDNHPQAIQSIWGHANTGNAIPVSPVVILLSQILFMGAVEGFRSGAITDRDQNYPGKFFDPLGMADDPDVASELKVKEIKNGRLAMLAMLAFYVQAIVTGKGPIENWFEHLSSPVAANALAQSNIGAYAPGQF